MSLSVSIVQHAKKDFLHSKESNYYYRDYDTAEMMETTSCFL